MGVAQVQERFLGRLHRKISVPLRHHQLDELLQEFQFSVQSHLIESYVDITGIFKESRLQNDLLSFFLDAEAAKVPKRLRSEVLEFLDDLAIRDGKRLLLFHPTALLDAQFPVAPKN